MGKVLSIIGKALGIMGKVYNEMKHDQTASLIVRGIKV